jgi:hypothetical protein
LSARPGIGGIFDHQVARIRRIVEEEFSGCSAAFDQGAWPMVRIRIQDANGEVVSKTHAPFSIAELQGFSEARLRSAIRNLCDSPR